MKSDFYFWVDGKIVEIAGKAEVTTDSSKLLGAPCVDLRFSGPIQRYGMFAPKEKDGTSKWVPIPFHLLPVEFRLALLLLGVEE